MTTLDNLWRSGTLGTLLSIVAIIVGARVLHLLARVALRRWLDPERRAPDQRAQVRTLLTLLDSLSRYIIYFTALSMILTELDRDVRPLLASASVIGLAFALAGQQFLRDVIGGFLLIFEGIVQVGDVVTVGDATGEVERISLRTTQIRKYSGELVTIPNGQIQQIGNLNREFMRALVQVDVANEVDVRRAMQVVLAAGAAWAHDHAGDVLGAPEVQGIMHLGPDRAAIRLVVTVVPSAWARAERDLRLAVKQAFDAAGFEMASASRVAHVRVGPQPGTGPSGDGPVGA